MRDLLIDGIDESYQRKAWHGPTLRGALRGVSVEQALWRPAPDRHCIWDLVVHCAYWKYTVRRRVAGDRRASFARRGSNWFALPEPTPRNWRADLQLLGDEHRALRETVASLPEARVRRALRLIRGIAYHDVYHAGQIQLLKKLAVRR
jgi:DinB superfamily